MGLPASYLFGVLAFSVAQRRQEIGVRMALSADPSSVRGLILSEVARFLLIGAAIGLPAKPSEPSEGRGGAPLLLRHHRYHY